MFLLPLQPLPGAPSVQSPESSGLLDIGTGFRDMLQNAQQQLDAGGAPISPMPERPMLAALMADLLNGAASGDEDTPKQIVSVLVSDAPVFEGTSNMSSGQVLPVPKVVPTVFEGEGILPEDVDAFVQLGQPVARKQGSPDIIANDTLSTTLPISEPLDVLPELQLRQTSQPISSDESMESNVRLPLQPILSDDTSELDMHQQRSLNVPIAKRQSVSVSLPSSSEYSESPLPVFRHTEGPQPSVVFERQNVPNLGGLESGQENVAVAVSAQIPGESFQSEDETDSGSAYNAQVTNTPVSGFVPDKPEPDTEFLNGKNDGQDLQNQNRVLQLSVPFPEAQPVIQSGIFAQDDGPVMPDETGEMDQAFSEQAPRDLTPMQHAGVVQVQPPIAAKPVFGIPEQPVSQPTEAHTPVVHVPLMQVETDVAVSPSHQVEPSNQSQTPTVIPPPTFQAQSTVLSQTQEVEVPVLSPPQQVEPAVVQRNTIPVGNVIESQERVAQPVLGQEAQIGSVPDEVKDVIGQRVENAFLGTRSSQVNVPISQLPVSQMQRQLGTERQQLPLIDSVETQINLRGQGSQAQPEMVTLLSSDRNVLVQAPMAKPIPQQSYMPQVPHSIAPESGILPQQQLETKNLQNTQMPQVSTSPENVFQPIIQAVVSESMDNDQTVLPRHPLDVVNAQVPQAPLTSENQTSHSFQTPLTSESQVSNVSQAPLTSGSQVSNVPQAPLTSGSQVSNVPQTPLTSESRVSNVPQASIISTSIEVPAASPMTEEAQTMGATRPIFAQQVQTVQREVVPDTIERETPVITQPKQAAVQDAIVTQQVVVSEDRTLRSVERPVQDVSTSSERAENRLFVASEGQMNEDTGREQRDSSRQTFVAPTAAPEQAASTTFEEVGGPDASILNIEQNVDLESQAIERISGRPEMRVDMMPRAVSTSDVAQRSLDTMPSEQIDRNYQVSEQVIRNARVMMREGTTQVTMRLDPQELGEVTIRLSTKDQVVSGEILVENQKVQEIVQRNLGTLRDALAGQGIQLENIDVSVNDRGAQADREAFRESLQERSGEREQREQARSDSQRWEQNERQQKQTPDGQVDFMA